MPASQEGMWDEWSHRMELSYHNEAARPVLVRLSWKSAKQVSNPDLPFSVRWVRGELG